MTATETAPAVTRRKQRLARAEALHVKRRHQAVAAIARADVLARQAREALDARLEPTKDGTHAPKIQQGATKGAYCTFRWYRFRCTCHTGAPDFGTWSRYRAEAERQRDEHLAVVGGLPVEFEAV